LHTFGLTLSLFSASTLAMALLMPLRDDRRGKRATVGGDQPLRPLFPATPAAAGDGAHLRKATQFTPYQAAGDLQTTLSDAAESPVQAPARTRVLLAFGLQSLVSALGLARPESYEDEHESDAPPTEESTFAGELARLLPAREPEGARAGAELASAATHDEARAVTPETTLPGLPAASETPPLPDMLDGEASVPAGPARGTSEAERAGGASEAAEPVGNASETAEPSSGQSEPAQPAGDVSEPAEAAGGAPPMYAGQTASLSSNVLTSRVSAFRRTQPPLTRLPLRPLQPKPAWSLLVSASYEDWSEAQRHEFLRACIRDPAAADEAILSRAYREENAAGRVLALKALAHARGENSREVFLEALRRGGDDERALAIDALAERGERGALIEALSDRVEAIAARAALAYLPGRSRAEYEVELTPFVDRARLDAILGLLAGVIL
jgi:hypothetical protein